MRSMLRIVLVLLAFGLVASTAGAATLSHTVSVPLQSTDWSATLAIPRFDPGMGALTSVSLMVRDSLVHKVEYENKSPSSTSRFRDSTYVTVDVLSPSSAPLVAAVAKIYQTNLVGIFDGTVDYAGTSGITVDGITSVAVGTSTLTAPADLAPFTGAGTVNLPCQATAMFVFGYNGGNASYRLTTQAQAQVLVTYTYDDTVVPATVPTWSRIKSLYR